VQQKNATEDSTVPTEETEDIHLFWDFLLMMLMWMRITKGNLFKSTRNYYVSSVKKLPYSERISRIMSHKDWWRLKNIPQQNWENTYGQCTVIYYNHLLYFVHFNGKGDDNTCTFTMSELTNI